MCRVHHAKCKVLVWIKISGRNINNLRHADDTTLMAEEELKSHLMKVKDEWKSWLKTQYSKNKDHGIWSHHFMANREKLEAVAGYIFLGSKIMMDSDCSHEIKKMLAPWKESYDNPDSTLKSRDITLPINVLIVKGMIFSSGPVWMWELDHKEGWMPNNWFFSIVVLEKTLESPLGSKEIKSVSSKGNQPWIFTGRSDAEAEAPILWPPDMKSWLTKNWCWERWKVKGEGVRESILRWIDKSRVLEEEKAVCGSQSRDRGLKFSRREGQTSFFSFSLHSLVLVLDT